MAPRSRAPRERGRDRRTHGGDPPLDLPCGRRVRLPHRRGDRRARIWRAEVDGQSRLRGDAEGGDGRGGRASSADRLRAAADRRDLRGPPHRAGRRASGDPESEPRWRPALGPRPAPVWIDRRCRIGATRPRRRPAGAGRDERGAARHSTGARGEGHRQPDGDDPGRGRAAAPCGPGRRRGGRAGVSGGLRRRHADGVLRDPDPGPEGPRGNDRVHRRGDREDPGCRRPGPESSTSPRCRRPGATG